MGISVLQLLVLYIFLDWNNALYKSDGSPIIDSDTLATITLFIAISEPKESVMVKRLVISILNRNR